MANDIENKIREIHISYEDIGQRIRIVRKKLGMTQPEFHKLIAPNYPNGNRESPMSNMERAGRKKKDNTLINKPSLDQLCAIAIAGNVSLEWLLMGDKDKQPTVNRITWRDFCRILTDMRDTLDIKVSIDDRRLSYENGKNVNCVISFPLEKYIYPSEYSPADLAETDAGKRIAPYLQVLSDVLQVKNYQITKYSDVILNDALQKVSDTPADEIPF